jgi:hypothetical protein
MEKEKTLIEQNDNLIKLDLMVKKVAKEYDFNKLFLIVKKSEDKSFLFQSDDDDEVIVTAIITNMGNFEVRKDYSLEGTELSKILDCIYDDMMYELIHFLASRNKRFEIDKPWIEIN